MTPLYRELHNWACVPSEMGRNDCVLVLADWIEKVKGVDPAAHVRGMYDTPGTCQRETGFLRDPVGAVDRCLATIGGLEKTTEPHPGDIAVLIASDEDGRDSVCGGLWMGDVWGCKTKNGATTLHPRAVSKVLAIWSVEYAA